MENKSSQNGSKAWWNGQPGVTVRILRLKPACSQELRGAQLGLSYKPRW